MLPDGLYVAIQIALLLAGLAFVFRPHSLIALVYRPARIKRVQWVEIGVVLLGIFLVLSAITRLYGVWRGWGQL